MNARNAGLLTLNAIILVLGVAALVISFQWLMAGLVPDAKLTAGPVQFFSVASTCLLSGGIFVLIEHFYWRARGKGPVSYIAETGLVWLGGIALGMGAIVVSALTLPDSFTYRLIVLVLGSAFLGGRYGIQRVKEALARRERACEWEERRAARRKEHEAHIAEIRREGAAKVAAIRAGVRRVSVYDRERAAQQVAAATSTAKLLAERARRYATWGKRTKSP